MKKLLLSLSLIIPLSSLSAWVYAGEIPEELVEACEISKDFSFEATPNMPENQAAFLGIHKGQWNKKLDSYLVVAEIDEDGEFEGYYYWGVYEPWGIPEVGCEEISGKIKKKVLKFKTSASQKYKLKKDHTSATFTRNGRTTNGRFNKL